MKTLERNEVIEAQNYLSECLWTLTETMEDLGYDVADLDGEELVDLVCRRLRKDGEPMLKSEGRNYAD